MCRITSRLQDAGFDERRCADRLKSTGGIPNFAGRSIQRPYVRDGSDAADVAISLFLLNEPVKTDLICRLFDQTDLDSLFSMRLITADRGCLYAPVNLFPCNGIYIATDKRFAALSNPDINPVMWLHPESYVLARVVDREVRVRHALDLCTGSGIHALLAAAHSDSVTGVDINPRAIAFSDFNRALNRLDNVEFVPGDLFARTGSNQYDLILANPPYNPDRVVYAAPNYWSGGASGEDILSRIISGLGMYLSNDGVCHIFTLLCHNRNGPTYKDKIDRWLDGRIAEYDVVAQVEPTHYRSADPSFGAHLRSTFGFFEFGVLSFRKALDRTGSYYHGRPLSTNPAPGLRPMVMNHSAFEVYRNNAGASC